MHFNLTYNQLGGHTHVVVRAGRGEAALGLCGQLTFRNEEWSQFKQFLEAGLFLVGEVSGSRIDFIENAG